MYYGAHPYPDNPPDGNTHQWEISVEQQDFVNGAVVYDRWYTQDACPPRAGATPCPRPPP